MPHQSNPHDAAISAAPAPAPWFAIGTLIFVLGAFALNSGFVFPANSLGLSALGYSAAYVGALGSVGAIGYILGSVLAPVAEFGALVAMAMP